jgi:prophage regulatory protein
VITERDIVDLLWPESEGDISLDLDQPVGEFSLDLEDEPRPPPVLLRLPEVCERLGGISKSTIYNWLDSGSDSFQPAFPRPLKLGARTVAWVESELAQFLATRPRA